MIVQGQWFKVSYDAESKEFVFKTDEGSHSCGESRSDWTLRGRVPALDLITALERLVNGETSSELL